MRDASAHTALIVSEVPAPQLKVAPDASGFRVALRMDLPLFVAPFSRRTPEPAYRVRPDQRRGSSCATRGTGHIRYTDFVVLQAGRKVAELPIFTVLAGGERSIRSSARQVGAGSGLRVQAKAMRARSTPRWPTRASAAALLGLRAARRSRRRCALQTPTDLAALTAAAEQDLAVVTVSYNGVRRDGLAYVLRDGDSLLVDADTLRRLAIRYDSSIATERDGRLLVPGRGDLGLSVELRQQAAAPRPDVRSARAGAERHHLPVHATPPPQLPNWGGYVNYGGVRHSALSGSDGFGFADTLGAGLTASLFGPYGVGTAGFLVNSRSANADAADGHRARRQLALGQHRRSETTLLVGDTVSTPGWWGRAVRFGGVQYGTNFALQPGFVTYPLMAVSGLASVPSTADILINNVRVAEQNGTGRPVHDQQPADDDRRR